MSARTASQSPAANPDTSARPQSGAVGRDRRAPDAGGWRRSPLLAYFLLAYGLSWCVFVTHALAAQGLLHGIADWTHALGAFGPLVAATAVTASTGGRAGLGRLYGGILRWRIGLYWWLAALSPLGLFLLAQLAIGLALGDWSGFGRFGTVAEVPGLSGVLGWAFWILTFGLGEEVGWRGFALPRLQSRLDPRAASLVLGLLWAGWHLPLFFYNYELSVFSLVGFLVGILSGAMVLTWLYNGTAGSLLAAIVWHGTYNAAVAGAADATPMLVTLGVIAMAVAAWRRSAVAPSRASAV